jgi:hypothetical protein
VIPPGTLGGTNPRNITKGGDFLLVKKHHENR